MDKFKRILTLVIAVPLGILLVVLAVANRQVVTLALNPFRPDDSVVSLNAPFFLILFLAVLIGMARQVPLPRQLLGEPWAHRLHREGGGIPYGVALAAGVLMIYPDTTWFTALVN